MNTIPNILKKFELVIINNILFYKFINGNVMYINYRY